jgi:hypothetical protein
MVAMLDCLEKMEDWSKWGDIWSGMGRLGDQIGY